LITTTAATVLLWAYAPYLYWSEGYLEKKRQFPGPDLVQASLTPQEIITRVKERIGKGITPSMVTLRADAGSLLYEIRYRDSQGKVHSALLDALNGAWRSPLSETDAVRFAQQYVVEDATVEEASYLENWVSRKAATARPAWKVQFSGGGGTEIFIDPENGAILEDQDRARRLHFWVMRVHQLNFFGTHKTLLAAVGLPLLVLIVTGLRMARLVRLRSSQTKRGQT